MADVVIRVGAALDANPDSLFEPLVKASAKAAALIKKNFEGVAPSIEVSRGSNTGATASRSAAKAKSDSEMLDDALNKIAAKRKKLAIQREAEEISGIAADRRAVQQQQRAKEDAAKAKLEADKAEAKAAKSRATAARESERSLRLQERNDSRAIVTRSRGEYTPRRGLTSMSDSELREHFLAQARVSKMQRDIAGPKASERIGWGAASAIGGALAGVGIRGARSVLGVGMDVAKGAGFDFDVGGAVGRHTRLESSLTDMSNAAWIPSEGKGYIDPKTIMSKIRSSSNDAGYSYQESADALSKFVSKTGDLRMGMDIFDKMSRLSRATGTNLQDMVGAVADVSNGLGDIPNKAEVMAGVMATIAGQGKIGAVEIKDLADKMGRIAAIAPHFSIKGANGEDLGAGESMKVLGGFAQTIRAKGGKATASETMTSVAAFFNQFSKTARLKGFERFGVNAIQEDGKIRDPREILKEALAATSKGGLKNQRQSLNAMFADERAKPIVTALQSVYGEAYTKTAGTEKEKIAAGKAAVQAEFDRMQAITMASEEIETAFAKAANTTEAKAAAFNNAMTDAASQFKDAVLPVATNALPHFMTALTFAAEGMGYFGEYVLGPLFKHFAPDKYAEVQGKGKLSMADSVLKYIDAKGYSGVGADRVSKAREQAGEARDIFQEHYTLKANAAKIAHDRFAAVESGLVTKHGAKGREMAMQTEEYRQMVAADKEKAKSGERLGKASATFDRLAEVDNNIQKTEEWRRKFFGGSRAKGEDASNFVDAMQSQREELIKNPTTQKTFFSSNPEEEARYKDFLMGSIKSESDQNKGLNTDELVASFDKGSEATKGVKDAINTQLSETNGILMTLKLNNGLATDAGRTK